MKYAVINPRGRVLRSSEDEFKFMAEGNEMVSISNEKAKQVEASSEPLFLVEGNLLTREEKLFKDNPKAHEERIKESLRPERNRLLAESDWTQLNDSPLPEDEVSSWAGYRQKLRDLTDNIDNNGKVELPLAP
tara:strand:- start:148 stop:546 length:399 start_codon:yes stop_codon:yes gene_type:complete